MDATAQGRDGEALVVEMDDALQPLQSRPIGIEVQGHVLDPQQNLKITRCLAERKIRQPPLEPDHAPGDPAAGKGAVQPGPCLGSQLGIGQVVTYLRRRGVQDLPAQIQLRRRWRQIAEHRPVPAGRLPGDPRAEGQVHPQVGVGGGETLGAKAQARLGIEGPIQGPGQLLDPNRGPVTKDRRQTQRQILGRHLKLPGPAIRRDLEFEPPRLKPQRPLSRDLSRHGQRLDIEPPLDGQDLGRRDLQPSAEIKPRARHLEGRRQAGQSQPVQILGLQKEFNRAGPGQGLVTEPVQIRAQAQRAPLRRAGQGGLEFQPMPRLSIVQGKLDTGKEVASGTGGAIQPHDLASDHPEPPLIEKMSQGRPDITLPAQREAGDGQLARRVPLQPQAQPLQDQALKPGFPGDQARREVQVQVQTRHAGPLGGVDRGRRRRIDGGRPVGVNPAEQDHLFQGQARGQARQPQNQAFTGHLPAQRGRQGRHQGGTQPVDVPQTQGQGQARRGDQHQQGQQEVPEETPGALGA